MLQSGNCPGVNRAGPVAEEKRVQVGLGNDQLLHQLSLPPDLEVVLDGPPDVAHPHIARLIGQQRKTDIPDLLNTAIAAHPRGAIAGRGAYSDPEPAIAVEEI